MKMRSIYNSMRMRSIYNEDLHTNTVATNAKQFDYTEAKSPKNRQTVLYFLEYRRFLCPLNVCGSRTQAVSSKPPKAINSEAVTLRKN